MRISPHQRSVFSDLPTGFGMALLSNMAAYNRFFNLSEEDRQHIIEGVYGISSKGEMRDYVTRTLINDISPTGISGDISTDRTTLF